MKHSKGTFLRPTYFLLGAATMLCASTATLANGPAAEIERPSTTPEGLASAFATQLSEDPDVPAFAIAVGSCKSIDVQMGGLRKVGGEQQIGSSARFNIGSNAKSMLATVAARLHDRGVLSLDSTVEEIWPEAAQKHPDKADITLAQLFAHSSGMPAFDKGSDLERVPPFEGAKQEIRRAAAEWFLMQPLETTPGEATSYSNAGYVIAGYLLEHGTGTPLETLLEAEVFEPLALDASLGEPRHMTGAQPWGHYVSGDVVVAYEEADPPIPPFLEAAGNVSLSPLAYARYLQAQLCALNGESDFIAPDTARRLHRPTKEGGSALGWGVTELNGAPVSFHVGGTGDFTAYAALSGPLDRLAFAILNVGGAPAQQSLQWLIEVMSLPDTEARQ